MCVDVINGMADTIADLERKLVEREWIPVSERLPEERAIVNVTFADGTVGTARFYWKGCPILFGCIMAENSPTAGDIVAWQPLPEPYKGGDTE